MCYYKVCKQRRDCVYRGRRGGIWSIGARRLRSKAAQIFTFSIASHAQFAHKLWCVYMCVFGSIPHGVRGRDRFFALIAFPGYSPSVVIQFGRHRLLAIFMPFLFLPAHIFYGPKPHHGDRTRHIFIYLVIYFPGSPTPVPILLRWNEQPGCCFRRGGKLCRETHIPRGADTRITVYADVDVDLYAYK